MRGAVLAVGPRAGLHIQRRMSDCGAGEAVAARGAGCPNVRPDRTNLRPQQHSSKRPMDVLQHLGASGLSVSVIICTIVH